MRTFIIFFLLLCVPICLSAQTMKCPDSNEDCGYFQDFIKAAQSAASGKSPKFDEAITQYNAARVCCPSAAATIDSLVLEVFKMIEKQRDAAIKSEKKASAAEKQAQTNLKKANTLIGHFYFTQERAWAYKNGKFAVINRDGELKSKFIYDRPDTFQTNGHALVFKGKNQLLIDVEGHESPEYKTLFPTNKGGYWAEKESKYTFTDFRGQLLPEMEWYMKIDTFSDGMARVLKDSLWGYIDATGKLKVPAKFSGASSFRDGAAWVEEPKKGWGMIGRDGRFIIEPTYSNAQFVTPEVSFTTKKGKWGVIDKTGKYIVKPEYDDVGTFEDGMVMVWEGDKIGFVNEKGEEVIPPQFTSVTDFSEGFAIVRADSATRNFIDKNGKVAFPSLQIEKADNFSEGLASVKEKGKKYGYIDKTGTYKIEPQFEDAQPFSKGVAWVKLENRKWVLANTKGEVISDTVFEKYRPFEGKLAAVKQASGWGFVTSEGKLLVPTIYEEVEDFENGYAGVQKDGLWGIIDSTGKIIAKIEYTQVRPFSEGIAAVQKESKWLFINTSGNLIAPISSTRSPEKFKDGVVWIADEDRNWRLLNRKGDLVADIYFGRYSFNEGLGAVMKRNNKWGFIDTLGNEAIPFIYRSVGTFNNGLAYFTTDTTWGFIEKSGKIIFSKPKKTDSWQDYSYSSESISEGLIAVQDSGKWGFIDLSGRWAIPARYDEVNGFEKGYAMVMEGEQTVFIDKNNKTIARCPVSDIYIEEVNGKMIKFIDNYYGRSGFLNLSTGKTIGPLNGGEYFSDGVLWVGEYDTKNNYKAGLMDENGEYLIPPKKYGGTYDFEDGVAWVLEDNAWWLIDKQGNRLTTERITSKGRSKFCEGLASAYQGEQRVYVDKSGQIVIRIDLESGDDSDDLYAPRSKYYPEEYGYYENESYDHLYSGYAPSTSRYGDYRAPSFLRTVSSTGDFCGGFASVRKGKKWGYIDKTGTFKIPERYDWAGNFSEGLAWVVMGERRKLITPTGDSVRLVRNYEGSFPFSGGVAIVVDDEENFGMIDRYGEEIVPLEYEALAYFSEGLAAAKKDGKWGYINRKGEEVIPMQFDAVYDFKRGKATVKKDNIYFIINKKGQLIVDESLEQSAAPAVLDDSDPQSGGGNR